MTPSVLQELFYVMRHISTLRINFQKCSSCYSAQRPVRNTTRISTLNELYRVNR